MVIPLTKSRTFFQSLFWEFVAFLLYVLFLLELEGENLVDDYCGGKLK